MRRHNRSKFDALDGDDRVNLREAAVTMAQQGLRKPMVQAEDARPGGSKPMVSPDQAPRAGGAPAQPGPIPSRRQTGRPPGNQGGTYNGEGHGTTAPDTEGGVELMAHLIVNQSNATSSRAPSGRSNSAGRSAPSWPSSSGSGAKVLPRMRRRG